MYIVNSVPSACFRFGLVADVFFASFKLGVQPSPLHFFPYPASIAAEICPREGRWLAVDRIFSAYAFIRMPFKIAPWTRLVQGS